MREGTQLRGREAPESTKAHQSGCTQVAAASITRANRLGARSGAAAGGGMRCDSDTGPWDQQGAERGRRQGVAPTAQATCRHVGCHGNDVGKCRTMRRTDRSTQTATLSSRSRSVVTCAVAQAVPAA